VLALLLGATGVPEFVAAPEVALVFEAGVVLEAVVDAFDPVALEPVVLEPAVLEATVLEATVLEAVPWVLLLPWERSIVPTFGDTSEATESEGAALAAVLLLDPDSLPQAARVSVARVHSTTLRICE
jgi:hypothetical protein